MKAVLRILPPVLGLAALAAAAPSPVPDPAAGPGLAERVEARLAGQRDALRPLLGHYGLVFPVEEAELRAFMRPIRVFGEPGALVLGTAHGLESHGGGLLALLLEHWRPEDRPARLADRFSFEANRARLPLAALYASNRRQVFLPVAGRAREEIAGALPDAPVLPRMRFALPGMAPVETDAYRFLGVLAAHEPDLSAPWTNALGQRLTGALLLEHARGHYLATGDTPAEPEDHSNLHLVEVLLGAARRTGADPEPVKRRFLANELTRRVFEPADETLLLAHYAESLGLLAADPRTRWSPAEARRVRDWLAGLDTAFRDLEGEEPRRLAHLLRGLRLLREHRARFAPAD